MPHRRSEDAVDHDDRTDQGPPETLHDTGDPQERDAERGIWESIRDAARPGKNREAPVRGAPRAEGEPATWDPRTGAWVRPDELRPVFGAPDRRGRSGGLRTAIIGGLIGALVASAATFGIVQATGGTSERVVERRLSDPVAAEDGSGESVVAIAERARPWVVNINVETRRPGLFGNQLRQGTGSGVILRSDGHIVTNAHVVQGAESVRVTLANGEELSADVVGADTDTDVAVVKVDRTGLPAAVLGTAGDLKVGELTVAIGSPLGLRQSVTAGIVSALGRTVDRPEQQAPLVDMIQTDAAITQGNSGGALLDGNGALIGINTAIAASPNVGAEGIAFAIPVDIVQEVAEELIETGQATHPWLGIVGGNIDAETARQFGIGQGARVIEVVSGSPADDAGLEQGDVIVGFDGETITSMDELVVEIRRREVGATVPLEVVRGEQTLELEATLADRPDNL